MRKATTILLISFLALGQFAYAGGPWTRAKGEGYAGLTFSYLGYNSYFGTDGASIKLRRSVTELTVGGYVEYGFHKRFTAHVSLPFRMVMSGNTVQDAPYFPDTLAAGRIIGMNTIGIGGKYKFLDKKVLMAAHLNYETNTSSYDANSSLRTGPATHVIEPQISIGAGLGKFYTYAVVGPRIRTGGYSQDLDFLAEVGYSWNEKTYFSLVFSGRQNLTQGTVSNNLSVDTIGTSLVAYEADLHTGVSPNRQQYIGYGLKFFQKIGDFSINAGVYGGFGQRVPATMSLNLGVAYVFKKKKKSETPTDIPG